MENMTLEERIERLETQSVVGTLQQVILETKQAIDECDDREELKQLHDRLQRYLELAIKWMGTA